MEFIVLFAVLAIVFFALQWNRAVRRAATLAEAAQKAEQLQKDLDAARQEHERLIASDQQLREELAALKQSMAQPGDTDDLNLARRQADKIIADARLRAEEIGGSAYRALQEVEALRNTAKAMRNEINGYGDAYLKSNYSLLTDFGLERLAAEYGVEHASNELKRTRLYSQKLIKQGEAATSTLKEKDQRAAAIRFVIDVFNEKVSAIVAKLNWENWGTLEQRVRDAFALVNQHASLCLSTELTDAYLRAKIEEVKFAAAIHALKDRIKDEQRQLREQMRDEKEAQREIARALRDAARDEEALQKAMEKVQAQAEQASEAQRAAYESKLAELRAQLAEAEARGQRALSMAQQTKAGHVYVISNVGSFGEHVYKVGMTRRLDPMDRVSELGDASVPFEFDVHAMIWSEDAPALEKALHRRFVRSQVNKVNPRKEFFRITLEDLKQEAESLGVEVTWTLAARAEQYRESLLIEERLKNSQADEREWLRSQIDNTSYDKLLAALDEQ